MDLTKYYQRIREEESKIGEQYPILVSQETPDGGKAGQKTEAPRRLAAKLIVEGSARLANAAEAQTFRECRAEAKRAADQLADAAKMQVTVLASHELAMLREAAKPRE